MSDSFLGQQLDEVAAERRRITVYADEPHGDLAAHFSDWNADVRFDRLPAGTGDGFVTVYRGDEFLGSLDIGVFDPLLEPPASMSSPRHGGGQQALAPLLELLDGTTFRTFDRRQLLTVSREIEDRAYRVGDGVLHAGFQRADALAKQREVYETLADSGLETHVYIADTWDTDPVDGVTVHASGDGELGRYWFVVFASGTAQDCALVAVERPDGYEGFWTYDRERVDATAAHLRAAYWEDGPGTP